VRKALDIVVRCVSCVLLVTDQWLISAEDRSKHDMLFLQQNPAGGYLSGDFCLVFLHSTYRTVLHCSASLTTCLSTMLIHLVYCLYSVVLPDCYMTNN